MDVDVCDLAAVEQTLRARADHLTVHELGVDHHADLVIGAQRERTPPQHVGHFVAHELRARGPADVDRPTASIRGGRHVVVVRDEQDLVPDVCVGKRDAAGVAGGTVSYPTAGATRPQLVVGKREPGGEPRRIDTVKEELHVPTIRTRILGRWPFPDRTATWDLGGLALVEPLSTAPEWRRGVRWLYSWPVMQTVGGRYALDGPLGEGGMGHVYKARHLQLGKPFALKVISPAFAADNAARQRFNQEAKLASEITHPNIVSVVDFGEDDQFGAYMVMELVDGEPLVSPGILPMR